MRFLFKMFFLGFVGFALLPAFAPAEYKADAPETEPGRKETPSAFELASFVGQAVADVRGICERKPDMCDTGRELISYTTTRAREGIVIAYAIFRHGHPSMKDGHENAAQAATGFN